MIAAFASPGQSNFAQAGFTGADGDAAGLQRAVRRPERPRSGRAASARGRGPCAVEPSVPTCLSPAMIGRPERRRELVVSDRHDAAARAGAVLDAGDDLLADIAALVEIDAAELVHVGFVRERVADRRNRAPPRGTPSAMRWAS